MAQEKQDKLEELARQLEAAAEVRTWTERVELVRRCKLWGPVLEARGAAAGLANQLEFVFPQHATAVRLPPCPGLSALLQLAFVSYQHTAAVRLPPCLGLSALLHLAWPTSWHLRSPSTPPL